MMMMHINIDYIASPRGLLTWYGWYGMAWYGLVWPGMDGKVIVRGVGATHRCPVISGWYVSKNLLPDVCKQRLLCPRHGMRSEHSQTENH